MAPHPGYMSIAEFCAQRGIVLTPEELADLDERMQAYCRDNNTPWFHGSRLVSPVESSED